MRVAVLGLGLMGLPMSRRLLHAGMDVHVWNRTRSKAESLLALGATAHPSSAQAVENADITITMLEHGGVVESVIFDHGVAQALRKNSLLVDMSSIEPAQAKDHAKRLQALNIRYLDAPVSGGTIGAEQGTLAIMAGGNRVDFETARPVFEPLGRSTLVGPTGCGQLAKLANQMIVGITIGAVAEALLLCERGGADMTQVKAAITGGFADSRILQVHGERMIGRDFAPRGRMSVQLKDLRNALNTAQSLGFNAPVTHLLEDLYAEGIKNGMADLDHAALFLELARRNGMA